MLENVIDFLQILNNNLIRGLFISVAVVAFFKIISKNKFDSETSINLVKWIVLSYCMLTILVYGIGIAFPETHNLALLNRDEGEYVWVRLGLFFMHSILPLTLFINKISRNIFIVFVLCVLMNLGWLMETLTVFLAHFHVDYLPENNNKFVIGTLEKTFLFKGFIVGLFLVTIGYFWNRGKVIS